jgi:hypothetical protein
VVERCRSRKWSNMQLPTDTVPFLFTDIEGSTRFLQRLICRPVIPRCSMPPHGCWARSGSKERAKVSMRTLVESVEVRASMDGVSALELARDGLSRAGGIERLETEIADEESVVVRLAISG